MFKQTRFVLRCTLRHTRRATRKSLLSVLLAAVLIFAIAQLALMRRSHEELHRNTTVTARFATGIGIAGAIRLTESELIANPYYEAAGSVDADNIPAEFIFTNNIPRYTGEIAEITYAAGFDESNIASAGNVVIAGEGFLEQRGLKPGRSVTITRAGLLNSQIFNYARSMPARQPRKSWSDTAAELRRKSVSSQ